MPNPTGTNQTPSLEPYGAVKKMTELTRAAPLSGAPMSGRALGSPKRAQRRAVRGGTVPAPAQARRQDRALPAAPPLPTVAPQAAAPSAAQVWQDAANTPGASELVRWYATQATNAQ